MLAIVLSGGGAKGAYEVGVWKALKKLKIKYNIVTGTSIGALNGMMMTQDEFYKCLRLWKNIDFKQLYDDFENTSDVKSVYKSYFDKMLDGGIDTHKIEKIINSYYKPKKLYQPNMIFGVVSYNMTDRKPVYSTTRNTRPDQLKKYVLASATCYPAFKPTKIGTDVYIDGGFYDNLPLNLAVELGADEIIAVDLKAIGVKQPIKDNNVKVTYIEPKSKLEPFLMFESNSARKMINLGYNDTMKVFKRLEGDIYTFKKGHLKSMLNKYKSKMDKIATKYADGNTIKKLDKNFAGIIDEILEIFDIPVDDIYTRVSCNNLLNKVISKVEDIDLKDVNIDEIKKLFDRKIITKYFYNKINNGEYINSILISIFAKEFTSAIYLSVIK